MKPIPVGCPIGQAGAPCSAIPCGGLLQRTSNAPDLHKQAANRGDGSTEQLCRQGHVAEPVLTMCLVDNGRVARDNTYGVKYGVECRLVSGASLYKTRPAKRIHSVQKKHRREINNRRVPTTSSA